MATLYTINPSRRKKRRSGKRRSAKQRAATRKMLRARFASNPKKKKGRKSVKRRAARAVKRSYRRRGRRSRAMRFNTGNAVALLKAGAIAGAGAVLVDIGMGQVSRFLPAAFAAPLDASGNPQYGYYGAKAALAIALGTFGGRVMPSAIAEKMAEGSLTVLAYQFIRPMVPAGLALGYFNPAPTMRPTMRGAGAYVQGAGAYVKGAGAYERIAVRASGDNSNRGSRAANVLSMVARRAA